MTCLVLIIANLIPPKFTLNTFCTRMNKYIFFSVKIQSVYTCFCWTQVKAIAQLLIHFNWTWVGLVRGDREYGRFAVEGLLRELQGTNVCVAYQVIIPLLYNRQRILEIIQVETKTHWSQFYSITWLFNHISPWTQSGGVLAHMLSITIFVYFNL